MKVDTYKVIVDFELATPANYHNSSKLAASINRLVYDLLKIWAKDEQVLMSPTLTSIERTEENK